MFSSAWVEKDAKTHNEWLQSGDLNACEREKEESNAGLWKTILNDGEVA